MKKTGFILLAASSLVLLSVCDSFSLTDQFSRSTVETSTNDNENNDIEFALALSNISIVVNEQTQLYPLRGTAPYSFAVIGTDLSPTTQNNPVGSVSNFMGNYYYRADTAIGGITIQVVDAENKSASAQVTVLPPKVEGVNVTQITNTKNAGLSWTSYDKAELIDNFIVRREPVFNSGAEKSIGKVNNSWTDGESNSSKSYTYNIYAESGTYRSQGVSLLAGN